MPKTLIGVDLCNTISNVNRKLTHYFNYNHETYPADGIPRDYFSSPQGLDVFKSAKAYPYGAHVLQSITKAGCEIVYVTTRPKVAAFVTEQWLKTNNFPSGKVFYVPREIKASFMINQGFASCFEDDPLVIKQLVKTEMRYVFVKEWTYNTGLIHKKVIRFSNWRELLDLPLFEKQDINILLGVNVQREKRLVAQKGES